MKDLDRAQKLDFTKIAYSMPDPGRKRPLLGEMLVDKKIVTPEQLDIALKTHRKTEEYLGQTIIELGFASEEEVLTVLSEQLKIPYVRVKDIAISKEVIAKVPAKFAYYYRLIPTKFERNTLYVAMVDPFDIHTQDDLNLLLGFQIVPLLAGPKDMVEGLKKHYGLGAETVEILISDEKTQTPEDPSRPADGIAIEEKASTEVEASVAKLVDTIILQAVREKATDIHLEPLRNKLQVRFRIDGKLYDVSVDKNLKKFQDQIINRIKIMANLDIAKKRVPQDGRILAKTNSHPVDLRISILPGHWGEDVEIRILPHTLDFKLETLGLSKNDFEQLSMLIQKPHGLIFVTGPTGSGKSTTLYAFLTKIRSPEKTIITIEDPIEYEIDGILQMQVAPLAGFDFANGLRSMLRHDPNIMMVGEVRDAESAQIAIRMAITGHLVFSTLHTNDAVSAISRLMDMGIEPYLIPSSVEGIIAQRLVRKICEKCKTSFTPPKKVLEQLGVDEAKIKFYTGEGCPACRYSGYSGRTAIFEVLSLNNNLKSLISAKAPWELIKKQALSSGMKTLRQDGLEKAKAGITTLEEVLKVTE